MCPPDVSIYDIACRFFILYLLYCCASFSAVNRLLDVVVLFTLFPSSFPFPLPLHDHLQVRPCHTGDRCPTGKEDIHADLNFHVDLGLVNATDPAIAAATAAAATDGAPDSESNKAVFEHRWRLRVRDALVSAVAHLLPVSCGVLPGDVLVYSPLPPAAAGAIESSGGVVNGNVEPVVATVRFWRPDSAVFWKPEVEAFWEEPRDSAAGGGSAKGTSWGVPQAGRCISALAAPTIASDITAHVEKELILAGREASTTAEIQASVAELAGRIRVHETGRLAVRTAPSGYRVIDKSSMVPGEQQLQRQRESPNHRRGDASGDNNSGGGGRGATAYLNSPQPSAGLSPMLAFVIQGVGIVVLGIVLLMAQRLRSSPSLPSTSTTRRGSSKWKRLGSISTGSAGIGAVSGGEDEEGGGGGEGDGGEREGAGVRALFGKGKHDA